MHIDDDSWAVTVQYKIDVTDEAIIYDRLGDRVPELHIQTLTLPRNFQRALGERGMYEVEVQGPEDLHSLVLPVLEAGLGESPRGEGVVLTSVARLVVQETRVPTFGSPPVAFNNVASAVAGGTVVTGLDVMFQDGQPRPVLVLAATGFTIFISVFMPPLRALGKGLEFRVLQHFGLSVEEKRANAPEEAAD